MMRNKNFWTALIGSKNLSARIRRSDRGVRIKFSDGSIAWLEKDAQISESGFLGSVRQWARQRGAKSIKIEYE